MLVHMVVPLTPVLRGADGGRVNEVFGIHISRVVSLGEEFREGATVDQERPFCIMIKRVRKWFLRRRRQPVRAKSLRNLVDLIGFEPMTSSMPWKRAPNCATGPHVDDAVPFGMTLHFSIVHPR